MFMKDLCLPGCSIYLICKSALNACACVHILRVWLEVAYMNFYVGTQQVKK